MLRQALSALLLVTIAGGLGETARAGRLNPLAFDSLGTLNLAAGTYTVDTSGPAPVIRDGANQVLFTGYVFDQKTPAAAPYHGFNPEVAVFTFNSANLAANVTLLATGTRPVALLSQGNFSVGNNVVLNASGNDGGNAMGSGIVGTGLGGSGGPGAGRGGNGAGAGQAGDAGLGPGGGDGGVPGNNSRGDGAGFGGRGGGGFGGLIDGSTYGNLRNYFQAGSGGGGTSVDQFLDVGAGGGGGGGAIELGAVGSLTLGAGAQVLANGGAGGGGGTVVGGGGSGGGIFLHAGTISGGSFQANGAGINGGGGRILTLSTSGSASGGATFSASNGEVFGAPGPVQFGVLSTLIGDADGDCSVGAGDYAIWAAQFGQTGQGLTADFDLNRVVGAGDYALWAANFGKTCGPAAASVPEPSGLVLAGLAILALLRPLVRRLARQA